MRVQPSQLVSGCVLLNDVLGKTSRPIMSKDTVLTDEHITVLQKFLVETVNVSGKLADGNVFKPNPIKEDNVEKKPATRKYEKDSFETHYLKVVAGYGKMFTGWQNNSPIDMSSVRKLIIPLLKRMDEIQSAVYTLHHHATKKDYFYHHSVSVGILAAYLAKKLGLTQGEWIQAGLAGFLSDSGMAKVEPSIVTKASTLTPKETEEMKKHPVYSYRLVEHIPTIMQTVKLAVLQHHERRDGSGYPLGLADDKIDFYARIIAVCDTYHAMICERLYKEKQSPFKVIEEIRNEQFSKLDPNVVQLFVESLTNFSVGTKIQLSNKQIGEIVFVEPKEPTRPMVRVDGADEIVSLKSNPTLFINEILGT